MIELRSVSKAYQKGSVKINALTDVSLEIKKGEFVAILGPSGSGKSTLMHIIGLLDKPDNGRYLLNGIDVTTLGENSKARLRNEYIGFVFQHFYLLSRMTALENVRLPLIYSSSRLLDNTAAEKRLIEVGLRSRMGHLPNELSGGQQQRVAIARCLVNNPTVILADEPTGNLDSKSGAEIIRILRQLNEKGKTLLIVTHDENVARQARRIIRISDGRIVADDAVKDSFVAVSSNAKEYGNDEKKRAFFTTKQIKASIRQAVQSIVSNRLRSFLSILGILIGITAVVAMVGLGEGAKEDMSKRFSALGTNVLSIRPGAPQMRGIALQSGVVARFTERDVQEIKRLPMIKAVCPYVRSRAQAIYQSKNWNTQVEGVGYAYREIANAEPVVGRFFDEDDFKFKKKVALLGKTVAQELFVKKNPVGKRIRLNKINFEVLGVLPAKGESPGGDRDDVVVIPVTTAMQRLLGKDYYDYIDAQVIDASLLDEAKKFIEKALSKRHKATSTTGQPFYIRDMTEIRQTFFDMINTMTLLLGIIAAISLIVGGVGIMNIMLVSVVERTMEIGLRKAVGARPNDILLQFLVESIVLTVIGGVLGILFGMGAAWILSTTAKWSMKISGIAVVISFVFAVVTGILSGLWPSIKAARLEAIEALRYA